MSFIKKWLPLVIILVLGWYVIHMIMSGQKQQASTPASPNMGGMTGSS